MSRAILNFYNRYKGNTYEVDFDPVPLCPHCGRKMKVQARSKPHKVVGKHEDYYVIKVYRRCGNSMCPGSLEKPISPKNPYVMPGYDYDYEVQALICELKYKQCKTNKEIAEYLQKQHDIWIDESSVGNTVKLYEVACSQRYKPEIVEKVKKNGGIILTVDAMEPLKGEPPIYLARDELTGLKILAEKLPNQKEATLEKFHLEVKRRVEDELGVKVIGIMGDAEKEQVAALQKVFPEAKLFSCERHFYQNVLKEPLDVDKHVVVTIRAILRRLGDVKAYKARAPRRKKEGAVTPFIDKILETISALSNWTRKPRDPAFSGLELRGRLLDVLGIVQKMHAEVGTGLFTKQEERVIARLKKALEKCSATTSRAGAGLARIKEYLARIKSILDADDEPAEVGLERLRILYEELVKVSVEKKLTKFEKSFIDELGKYIETKGERLFAHRLVKGAPRTNNNHELVHLRLKHLLRRMIGHGAASYYLLEHGSHMIFVDQQERPDEIKKILQGMDIDAAKKIIAEEKSSRTTMSIIMHVKDKWKEKIADLQAQLLNLKRAMFKPS